VVTMPVKGSVRGSSGSITMKGSLRATNPADQVAVALTLDLTVDIANRQLVGRMTGSTKDHGTTTPIDDPVVLAIPGTMDGTWTLSFDLDQSGRNVTGAAVLKLSNDVQHSFSVNGRTGAHDTAVLTLSGDPADPASKALAIRATITPLEGGWAWIESSALKGYGQVVSG